MNALSAVRLATVSVFVLVVTRSITYCARVSFRARLLPLTLLLVLFRYPVTPCFTCSLIGLTQETLLLRTLGADGRPGFAVFCNVIEDRFTLFYCQINCARLEPTTIKEPNGPASGYR